MMPANLSGVGGFGVDLCCDPMFESSDPLVECCDLLSNCDPLILRHSFATNFKLINFSLEFVHGRHSITSIGGLDGAIGCLNGDVNRLHLSLIHISEPTRPY
eukprot:TRINITY_DN1465_c0_g1_i22.p3 TRINITY_DN1465_c0_g1~~TRINITY_DN1465_c0_g1_i22.p3  ORF type:complete len:102 (-),score=9.25 TRINITY_DN1465_c0_g1_i22:153-458(-)